LTPEEARHKKPSSYEQFRITGAFTQRESAILTPHHLMKAMASRGRACHLPAQEASYAE